MPAGAPPSGPAAYAAQGFPPETGADLDPDAPITPWGAAAAQDAALSPARPGGTEALGAALYGRSRPRVARPHRASPAAHGTTGGTASSPAGDGPAPSSPGNGASSAGGDAAADEQRLSGHPASEQARRLILRSAARHGGSSPAAGEAAAPRRRLRRAHSAASEAVAGDQSAPLRPGRVRGRSAVPQATRTRGLRPDPLVIVGLVLACVGAVGLVAFFVIAFGRSGGEAASQGAAAPAQATPEAAPPGAPLGAAGLARCGDGPTRFPGADNPEEAVLAAYRSSGLDVSDQNGATVRYVRESAPRIVGSWIATGLLAERAGQPPLTLAEWVGTAPDGRTLTNALLSAGRPLDAFLSPEQWDEIASWPPNTCEGAFVQNPRNAPLMALVEGIVAP